MVKHVGGFVFNEAKLSQTLQDSEFSRPQSRRSTVLVRLTAASVSATSLQAIDTGGMHVISTCGGHVVRTCGLHVVTTCGGDSNEPLCSLCGQRVRNARCQHL